MVYALLDDMVDGYFSVVDQFDSYYEGVSDSVFADRPLQPGQEREWFEMRRALSRFHRLVLPLREALSGLVRHQHALVRPDVLPYWQDLYDHIVVVSETTDGLRDIVNSLVDANLALRDYRQNQVVKKVSSWAAIVAVPDARHRLLRDERAVPGFRRDVWRDPVRGDHRRPVGRPLRAVPPQRVVVTAVSWPSGRRRCPRGRRTGRT